MVFNDTSNKNGMIQSFEFWTRQPDGTVSGASTLLKQATALINRGFDCIMPLLLSYSDYIRWDDTNHTDQPWGTTNLVSGQGDYVIAEDDNSLDILNLTNVRILQSSTATDYVTLERMTLDDPRVEDALSPNSGFTGIPSHFVENGNKIFLYPEPNYSATNGVKLFFEREQSYFTSADTTKEPGIPKPFHELPVLYASLDWNMVNRANDVSLLNSLNAKIAQKSNDLKDLISKRNPTRNQITSEYINHR